MNVGSIPFSSPYGVFGANSQFDGPIKALEMRKAALQTRLEKVRQSALDAVTKEAKIRDLEQRIREIDGQTQQVKAQKAHREKSRQQNNAAGSSRGGLSEDRPCIIDIWV